MQLLNDFNHIFTAGGIERAGRFVSEDDFAAVHQGAGDGDALLLTAGKFAGFVAFLAFQTQVLQQFFRTIRTLFAAHTHIHGRQGNVVPRRQRA